MSSLIVLTRGVFTRIYIYHFCVAKYLLGNTQALELHPMDAGCTFLQNVLSVLRMKHGKRTHCGTKASDRVGRLPGFDFSKVPPQGRAADAQLPGGGGAVAAVGGYRLLHHLADDAFQRAGGVGADHRRRVR